MVSFTVDALPCPSLLGALPLTVRSEWTKHNLPWKQSSRNISRVGNRPHCNLITRFMSSSKEMGTLVSRRNLLQFFAAFLLGVPPLLEIYSRLGLRTMDESLQLLESLPSGGSWDDVEHATLVFHGAGGQDVYTDMLMTKLRAPRTKSTSYYSSMVEWSNSSSNILQASFNAQRIGSTAATQLYQNAGNLKTVHLIGISVGAFAADAACQAIKSRIGESVFVQLTLLDPFTQRGIFDTGYGARNFGNDADYFQQYLNTDDPVPSTNAPLEKSVCFDITNIRPQDISFGHDWPVAYYGRKGKVGIVPPEERLRRGTLVKVES